MPDPMPHRFYTTADMQLGMHAASVAAFIILVDEIAMAQAEGRPLDRARVADKLAKAVADLPEGEQLQPYGIHLASYRDGTSKLAADYAAATTAPKRPELRVVPAIDTEQPNSN
jgi:hypothetical protein